MQHSSANADRRLLAPRRLCQTDAAPTALHSGSQMPWGPSLWLWASVVRKAKPLAFRRPWRPLLTPSPAALLGTSPHFVGARIGRYACGRPSAPPPAGRAIAYGNLLTMEISESAPLVVILDLVSERSERRVSGMTTARSIRRKSPTSHMRLPAPAGERCRAKRGGEAEARFEADFTMPLKNSSVSSERGPGEPQRASTCSAPRRRE